MTSLGRIFACMVAAGVFGYLGLIAVAIFGPLLFPLSLTDSSHAENSVVLLMLIVALLFGAAGVLLCWRLTSRWERKQ
jgi:H+/Cl- antiporter ClcA